MLLKVKNPGPADVLAVYYQGDPVNWKIRRNADPAIERAFEMLMAVRATNGAAAARLRSSSTRLFAV